MFTCRYIHGVFVYVSKSLASPGLQPAAPATLDGELDGELPPRAVFAATTRIEIRTDISLILSCSLNYV